MSDEGHVMLGLRGAHDQWLALHRLQPRVPASGAQPSLRPTRVEEAQQAGHSGPRGTARVVVSGLRRASTSLDRPDARPHGSSRARWRSGRCDERPVSRLQHPQAWAQTPTRRAARGGGWTKMMRLCGDQGGGQAEERAQQKHGGGHQQGRHDPGHESRQEACRPAPTRAHRRPLDDGIRAA